MASKSMGKERFESFSYYIGIDEAGRGPLAGPVAVGAVCAEKRFFTEPFFKKIKDSKQLSAQKRREIFNVIKKEESLGRISYAVSFVGPSAIDSYGINQSIYRGISRCLERVCMIPEHSLILLDGGLSAPPKYKNQITIIRGDEKEAVVALASIVAKVLRDERMERIGLKYPEYLFEEHKGYGTKDHFKRIKEFGPTHLHRKSYLY
jgi:ribonuclease HII